MAAPAQGGGQGARVCQGRLGQGKGSRGSFFRGVWSLSRSPRASPTAHAILITLLYPQWVDSDDEEAAGALPGGGMPGGFDFGDLSQFGNFENALETMGGGAGGGEEGDDDDEEVEEVEAETPAGDAGQSGSG